MCENVRARIIQESLNYFFFYAATLYLEPKFRTQSLQSLEETLQLISLLYTQIFKEQ